MVNTKDKTSIKMSSRRFSASHLHKYWLHFFMNCFVSRLIVGTMWWWWRSWLSSSCITYLVSPFSVCLYVKCKCQLEFTTSILKWGYILLSLFFFASSLPMSFLFLIDVVGFYIYIYMHVAQLTKEKAKERDEHILSRTYLYIHLWMLSFTSVLNRCCLIFPCRSSSPIFFFSVCPRYRVQEKH